MILRRPYGFLIKYFKLIHLIISLFLIFILLKFRSIYIFLSKCISDIVNKYDALSYINYSSFLYFLIVIFLLFIIYYLLKYKDKPRKFYLLSIIGYVFLSIILFIIFTYFNSFSSNVIESKTLRLLRDIVFLCNLFQYCIIIIMLIRGLGFNIKKFNFEKDAQELNLTDADSEEIEVNARIDFTDTTRKIRKKKREFGYYLAEFRIYVIILLIVVVLILGFKFYNFYVDNYKVYKQNEYVGTYKHISVIDSFFKVSENANYVIIKFNTFKNGRSDKLNVGNIKLSIGNKEYIPNKNVCYKFNNIAPCYKQQYLNNSETSYILVYKVDNINVDKAYILYNEVYDKTYKIRLNLKNN